MIPAGTFLFSAVVAGLAAASGLTGIAAVTGGLAAIYGLCCLLDIFSLSWQMRTAGGEICFVGETPRSTPSTKGPVLTSCGIRLGREIEAWRYRQRCFEWFVSHRSESNPWKSVKAVLQAEPVPSNHRLDDFMHSALARLQREFRGPAIALVVESNAWQGVNRVYSHGIMGSRFEQTLQRCTRTFLEREGCRPAGTRVGPESLCCTDDFAAFGFPHIITEAFAWQDSLGLQHGVLWLGYDANHPPLRAEVERAKSLARQLGQELEAVLGVNDLQGRINEARDLDKEKTEIIAQMSHDLRSPLGNLKAILTVLDVPAHEEEFRLAALKSCEALAELIEDLVDYSRHRLGKLEARAEDFPLAELVCEVASCFRGAAQEKALNLVCCADVQEPLFVHADRGQIRRVLTNLLSNAVKYTQRGEIRVDMEFENTTDEIVIKVSDTGTGLSAQQQQQLFTPFARFHPKTQGIGLGLALSRILVGLNGGTIEVRSQAGTGSEFRVRLRRCYCKGLGMLRDSASPAVVRLPVHAGKPSRVLVVDDDRQCAATLARALRAGGIQTAESSSVSEACSFIVKDCFDAIVSDAGMPDGGVSGILAFLAESGLEIPVLTLTGTSGQEEYYLSQGARAVMLKPADIEELMEWVGHRAPASDAVSGRVSTANLS